jgi:transposase
MHKISIDIFKYLSLQSFIMRITRELAIQMVGVLEDLWAEIRQAGKAPYPYAEWERKRDIIRQRLEKLPEYVKRAAGMVAVQKRTGRPKSGTLVQRTMLFLFARLMNKSNRDAEKLLGLFGPLFDLSVSYKSIERLYSDPEVNTVLHNLFLLLLRDEGVSGDVAGDGTGYALSVTKHYRTSPSKKGMRYLYSFRVIDLGTGMYLGVGYSPVSEMRAFRDALGMMRGMGLPVKSARLDKYFSSRKVLELFGTETAVYVLPKKDISRMGLAWSAVIKRMMESPFCYIKEYLMRNLSESGHSSDKGRFGSLIRQKRLDRQEMALFSIALLHNIFFVRVNQK